MSEAIKSPGGRPRKFQEPSHPTTITLPQRTLDQLRMIDADRAKAIVKAVDRAVEAAGEAPRRVDVVEMAPGAGLLVVSPNRSLRNIPWLKMIEITPQHCLLSIESGTSIEKVELALLDLIEDATTSAPLDVPMLEELREQFGRLRRGDKFTKAEILLVDTSL